VATKPGIDDIHSYLRERIVLLDLPPGARLREERLADHFGVSRTPIRQVLHRLEFEGLVEQAPGAGARVSPLDPKMLRDVWAVRLKLAELVGDFVRLPASGEVVEQVEKISDELDTIKQSREIRALGELYNRYHAAMLSVVNNAALVRIHDLLYVQTARVWMQFLPEMDLDLEIDVMKEEVGQTLEALRGSSGQRLAEIRSEHMSRLLKRFNEHVTSIPAIPA
jgi:DNA-binding GntR family transcriptional regulator